MYDFYIYWTLTYLAPAVIGCVSISDGYQRGLAAVIYKFLLNFSGGTVKGEIVPNQQLAEGGGEGGGKKSPLPKNLSHKSYSN